MSDLVERLRKAIEVPKPHAGDTVDVYMMGRYDERTNLQPVLLAMSSVCELVEDAQCDCSVSERDSGHLIGCWMPEFNEALARVKSALEDGE